MRFASHQVPFGFTLYLLLLGFGFQKGPERIIVGLAFVCDPMIALAFVCAWTGFAVSGGAIVFQKGPPAVFV